MAPVPVVGGGGDNAAGAVGVGVVSDGDALLSLGTSGVIFIATKDFRPNPGRAVHAFCHCLPQMWHQMSVHLSAAACIDWVAKLTGAANAPELFTRAESTGPARGKEVFLPYLSGERTPHNDAVIRGAFIGLEHESSRVVLTQAVLEGVSFAIRDNLEALRSAGTDISRVTAIGGGSRSRYWLASIATALGVPVDLPADGDFGAAFGAARLGLIAATGADPVAVCTPPKTAGTIEPVAALSGAYEDSYKRYRALYPAIKSLQH
jgi:xylulokinase